MHSQICNRRVLVWLLINISPSNIFHNMLVYKQYNQNTCRHDVIFDTEGGNWLMVVYQCKCDKKGKQGHLVNSFSLYTLQLNEWK